MQELDDIRNRLKALAKDLSAISSKHDDEFDAAVDRLEDAFTSIVDVEERISEETLANGDKKWFE